MTRLWHFSPDFNRYFRDAAKRIAGVLRCGSCGAEQPCPADLAEHYLRNGWPIHCSETMSLASDTPDQEDEHPSPLPPGTPHRPRRS